MNDDLRKQLSANLTPYDYHKYANVKPVEVETVIFAPQRKYVDDDEAIKAHLNDSPLSQVHCGYMRLGYNLPLMKFEEDRVNVIWTCRLYEGERIHEGKSRDRQTASHIAATYMLDSAIEDGKSMEFFLPTDKEAAHRHVAAKRNALIKLTEEKNATNTYALINEYAQFNKIPVSAQDSGTGTSFASTIIFDGKEYKADGQSKKEARKCAAGIIYAELLESNKYFAYMQEKEKTKAEKKLRTMKYRLPKDTASLSMDETGSNGDTPNKTLNPLMIESSVETKVEFSSV